MKTAQELKTESAALKAKAQELYDQAKILQREERKAKWRKEKEKEYAEIEESKSRLAKEYNLERNAKFEKAYALAWDYGHSSGINEVENYFHELAPLLA